MPIAPRRFPAHHLVVSRFEGAIDDDVLVAYYRALLNRDDVPLHWKELIDLRGVTSFAGLSPAGFEAVADLVGRAYSDDAARSEAVVVAPDDLAFGLARMYELGRTPEEVPFQVHRTVAEALERLGLGDEAAAEVERLLS
jgi:hypothetical protein